MIRIKYLINKTNGLSESKANTASLEKELVQIKKNNTVTINKWKSHAQKLKMER